MSVVDLSSWTLDATQLSNVSPTSFVDPNAPVPGIPLAPPARYFDDPPADLVPGDVMVITEGPDVGRYARYVSGWDQCILDGRPGCWMPGPSPTGYAYANQGRTQLDDGRVIATANLGGWTFHAPDNYGIVPAERYYENTASQRVRVRYGENEHGPFAVGCLWPEVTPRQVAELRASPLSGDWRWQELVGDYDLSGSQLVNVPGLPIVTGYRAAALAPDGVHVLRWVGSFEPQEGVPMAPTRMIVEGTPIGAQPATVAACACGGVTAAAPDMAPADAGPDPNERLDALEAAVSALAEQVGALMDQQVTAALRELDAMPAALA